MISTAALVVLSVTSVVLFAFGINLLFLSALATRIKPSARTSVAAGDEELVCVQIPIYNERYVAGRVIDAAAGIEWPRDRLEIQVLDDSDDETTEIVMERAVHWRKQGFAITHVRRGSRAGFKAGALTHGLSLTRAPYIAIFDADFVPPPDFLYRIMPVFENPRVGFAQARWGFLNETYSLVTRLQALAIDFHFFVEQSARSAFGYFTNFTGTAGVWRRAAIDDSGGWSFATLTEDLDLSYRAQLRGWRAAFVEDLEVPQELPVSINAYRKQQSRWATGSFQTAFRLFGRVMRAPVSLNVKLQASVHLLAYGVGPLMLAQLLCYPLLLRVPPGGSNHWLVASVWINLLSISPWVGFVVAQRRRGRPLWTGVPAIFCQLVGAGMALTVLLAFLGAFRAGGEFVRTPKHRIVTAGQEWRDKAYIPGGDPLVFAEAVLGVGALALVPAALSAGRPLIALYSALFAVGFLSIAGASAFELFEVVALRNPGRRALKRLVAAAPAIALLAACAALTIAAAQLPETFEDGYQHWLIAANLASTGRLADPIFGMQDTWLPGYGMVGAAVLKFSGLWQLGLLKTVSALFGIALLATAYRLAPNARQARYAVALLALNPVFLLTSGSAVAEPMLTALLYGAALAAVRGRFRLAALLAALACLTGTKAWIWMVAVVGFAVIEWAVSRRAARTRPAIGWAAPAVAALVVMQLAFAPATHSLTRGSVEAASAAARGSIPPDAVSRLLELAGTFGLAALPLVALAPIGLWLVVGSRATGANAALIRFAYAPALIYLAAVVILVADGSYSGSQRYFYPALPALALLAAQALDRKRAAVPALGAVGAGALLSVGFLPVFAGFAHDNAGLVAAGQFVRGQPGAVLTDSPVVAYESGKAPSEIYGSQNLPSSRDQAVVWIRDRGIRSIVLEDISYYRATSVFGDLSAGSPKPPFETVGDESRFNLGGGKPVSVYSVGEPRMSATLFGNVTVALDTGPQPGKTAPLAKGLVMLSGKASTAGEGMGFGVPIVQYADGWVYPATEVCVDESTVSATVWRRTFSLDEIGGDAAHDYRFEAIPSRGTVVVTYTVTGSRITVDVTDVALKAGYTQVGILNEQSAAFENYADSTQTLIGPSFGSWVPVSGVWARLRSSSLGIEWSVPALPGATLHGGRELAPPDFDWAGLDYMFSGQFIGAHYVIEVQSAR